MCNKKKMIIINNNLANGGVQKSLVNLLNEIKDLYEITLFVFSNSGDFVNSVPQEVKVIEANPMLSVLGISQGQAKKDGFFFYALRTALAAWSKIFNNKLPIELLIKTEEKLKDYDIAISYLHCASDKSFYGGCNEFVLKRVEAYKKLTFIHCDFLNYGGNTKKNRKVYKQFNQVAVVSDGCKNRFLQALPELMERTHCVRNVHDYRAIVKMATEDPVLYSHDYFNIVTVARLSKEKGIERAIPIIKKLLDEKYPVKWHVIGGGPLKSKIEQLIKIHFLEGKVILYGNQENPYRYMVNADVFLLPSIHEAAPMVIDEAKILGVPVITTNTTSAKEMIIANKEGFVCENNLDAIYKQIKDVLNHPQLLTSCRNYLNGKMYSNYPALKQFRQLIED